MAHPTNPDEITIRVQYGTKHPQLVQINTRWTIPQAKERIKAQLGVNADINVLFAGRYITDDMTIKVCLSHVGTMASA